jgi:hypothetical protein
VGGPSGEELDVAKRILQYEDLRHDAYANLRRAIDSHLLSENFDLLRTTIQEGREAALTADELGPACALLSEDDFLFAKLKTFNTTLEVEHGTPAARDLSPVANKAKKLLSGSASMPSMGSQENLPGSPTKAPAKRVEWTAEEDDKKLGFTPAAWPPSTMTVLKVDSNTWSEKFGIKAGDVIAAINGVDVGSMTKQAVVQSLKERPVKIAFIREVEDEIMLEKIKEHMKKTLGPKALAPKRRIPGMPWNGRVEGMSVDEYRELKWSVDACFAKVERRGPKFSIRAPLPSIFAKKTGNQGLMLDVLRSYETTLRSVPKWTCSMHPLPIALHATPGPEYHIKSTMDPSQHPTIPKTTGPRFGAEVLNPRDPTGPAPGDYDPNAIIHSSTIKSCPNLTIQGREAWREPTAPPGPGVGEYKYEHAMRTGKLTPLQYKMQGRNEPVIKPSGISPGPPHYFRCSAGQEKSVKHLKFNPTLNQAPIWKFGCEPRGLRN